MLAVKWIAEEGVRGRVSILCMSEWYCGALEHILLPFSLPALRSAPEATIPSTN